MGIISNLNRFYWGIIPSFVFLMLKEFIRSHYKACRSADAKKRGDKYGNALKIGAIKGFKPVIV